MKLPKGRVVWQYVSGGGIYGMKDRAAKGGSGTLSLLKIGSCMFITGDLGLVTTPVQSIEKIDGWFYVKTMNSVYKVAEQEFKKPKKKTK
jgi:hypothetical protein